MINKMIIPATPKVLNMDNPVQAAGAVRGRTKRYPRQELRSSSTPAELCISMSLSPRAAAIALHEVIHIQLLRSYLHWTTKQRAESPTYPSTGQRPVEINK
jgi:hypothetical protein